LILSTEQYKSTPPLAQGLPGICGQEIRILFLGKYYPFTVNPAHVPGFRFHRVSILRNVDGCFVINDHSL
jgi:hypothetical protein